MSKGNGLPLLEGGRIKELRARRISEKTCQKFGYRVSRLDGQTIHIAPLHNEDGELVAQKVRYPNKRFEVRGEGASSLLFGRRLWRSEGGKRLVITEGEIDALSYAEATGGTWPVVSVPTGASGAAKAIKANLEWIESFDEVVFMFDMDDPGQKAAIECAELITPGKAKIAYLPLKDANDMLVEGRVKELVGAAWEARTYRPDGIIAGDEIELKDLMEGITPGYATPYPVFNEKYGGLRKGEILLVTAGSGIGKSTWARELAYHLHCEHGLRIGNIYLEESYKKTAQGYIAIDRNIPLGKLRTNPSLLTQDEWEESYARTIKSGRMFFYKHWGSLESDNLMSRLRYMAVSLECDFVVLDHISIVVSGMESSREGERKDIDRLMTRLRSLVEETGMGIIAIVHLRQPEGKPHEEGGRVTLSELRGSGSLKQIPDGVAALERNQQSEVDQDRSLIRILKNREFGDVGPADVLRYNRETGRLLPDPDASAPRQSDPSNDFDEYPDEPDI